MSFFDETKVWWVRVVHLKYNCQWLSLMPTTNAYQLYSRRKGGILNCFYLLLGRLLHFLFSFTINDWKLWNKNKLIFIYSISWNKFAFYSYYKSCNKSYMVLIFFNVWINILFHFMTSKVKGRGLVGHQLCLNNDRCSSYRVVISFCCY